MTVRWGILSTARINDKFLAGAALSSSLEVAAVASRDRLRGEQYAQEHGIARAYGSYEELLADPEIDAVYISLPNSMHLPWTEEALRAGKHVLCEKPLGRRAADVEAAFDLAQREERFLMEAFMYRHHPQTEKVVELVRSGAIGTLRLLRGSFSFPLGNPADGRLSAELDGGSLMDVGCYCVSALRLLGGEPTLVTGQQLLGDNGVDLAFAGTMCFPGGALGHFDAGFVLPDRDELEVVGDQGSLFIDDPWHCRSPLIELRREGNVESIEIEPLDSYRLEAENLSAAIRGQAEPLLGREDAVRQASAIEALYRAATTGRAEVPGAG